MNILITNDDGFYAEGIKALFKVFSEKHNVFILAPSKEQSGKSMSITFTEAMVIKKIDERVYSCSGTPSDCSSLAIDGALEENNFDLILSGINNGPNLGTDILYSGTAAAARQAVLKGVPAIACSSSYYGATKEEYYLMALYLEKNLNSIMNCIKKDTFLNINFPKNLTLKTPYINANPVRRVYKNKLKTMETRNIGKIVYIELEKMENKADDKGDYFIVERGEVSLSTILIHPITVT